MDDGFIQTLHGLIRKRAEMVGEIEGMQATLLQRTADLHALEAAIRIFDPNIDAETLPARRIPPAYAAFRGEMARFFLTTLRDAPDGMTTAELTAAIMHNRRLDLKDKVAFTLIMRRTQHSLAKLRTNGHLRSARNDPSGMMRWWRRVPPFPKGAGGTELRLR